MPYFGLAAIFAAPPGALRSRWPALAWYTRHPNVFALAPVVLPGAQFCSLHLVTQSAVLANAVPSGHARSLKHPQPRDSVRFEGVIATA